MAEKKRCIRCERAIDTYARICPFCNWDQNDPAVTAPEQISPENAYVPPREQPWRKYALMAVGGVLLLIAAFALGSKLQGHKPPVRGMEEQEQAAATSGKTSTAPTRPAPHADVTLVPVNANDTVAVEAPITSAPVATQTQGVPPEFQRSDATAVSSVEYQQLAARAEAERKARQAQQVVDPRTLKGAAYEQGEKAPAEHAPQMSSGTEPPPSAMTPAAPAPEPQQQQQQQQSPAPAPPARATENTRPVPEYQPIPDIQVSEATVARLKLTVGADGRVKEVNVLQGIPGQTSKIISTVQTWRFRPATENGEPVAASFNVDLSFRGQ